MEIYRRPLNKAEGTVVTPRTVSPQLVSEFLILKPKNSPDLPHLGKYSATFYLESNFFSFFGQLSIYIKTVLVGSDSAGRI